MIQYKSSWWSNLCKLFQMKGSVFPQSMAVALPCALLSALVKILVDEGLWSFMSEPDSVLKPGTQAWSGFSFLVGFLIVFRTSQAYSRFWNGCTVTHQMRAEWFDACSALASFCKYSTAPSGEILKFIHTLIRLFSMLHCAALAELEEINTETEDIQEIKALNFELIDPEAIDKKSLMEVKMSKMKVELIFSWIQSLIIVNMRSGVLNIPAPILARAFQEIANGMVAFHDAIKITYVPFPFPYAQTCDCLLVLHWLITPIITCHWVSHPSWGAIFVFVQVFILWALNFIASEIENPFGNDANDIDGCNMQLEFNQHLLLLVHPSTSEVPKITVQLDWLRHAEAGQPVELDSEQTFTKMWTKLNRQGTQIAAAHSGRKDIAHFSRASAHKNHDESHRHSRHSQSDEHHHPGVRRFFSTASTMTATATISKEKSRSTFHDCCQPRMAQSLFSSVSQKEAGQWNQVTPSDGAELCVRSQLSVQSEASREPPHCNRHSLDSTGKYTEYLSNTQAQANQQIERIPGKEGDLEDPPARESISSQQGDHLSPGKLRQPGEPSNVVS